jgi:hypothetical protein
MERSAKWLTGVAVVGLTASVLGGRVLWLVLTRPEAMAVTIGSWLQVFGIGR